MGLGKTVQTIALVVATLDDVKRKTCEQRSVYGHVGTRSSFRHTTLIVVPPSLLEQWISEIHKIAPWLVVDTLVHVSNTLRRVSPPGIHPDDALRDADIMLITYQGLEENARLRTKKPDTISLADQIWGRIVLDEMQEIRSWTTRISKLINNLRSNCRWMLSGTPLLDDITDLRGELCFLGLEPFSASNDDGYFHFAVASHWEHKSLYGLSIMKKLAELVMLRRSKSMVMKESGLPLLGLKPFTLTYEPVPQDDSERAIYCFLEYVMHSTVAKDKSAALSSNGEEEDYKQEARRRHEQLRHKIVFLRTLRDACLSTNLLNGGLGCASQLEILNRWMQDLNRKLHQEAIQHEGATRQSSRTKALESQGRPPTVNREALSCDEAVRFLSQVEDLARTDLDFVTDVHVGGGGGKSNRRRAMESLDERYQVDAAECERLEGVCASASSTRAKAYWHLALEGVTTGKLFANDEEACDRVGKGIRCLWRWRSCSLTCRMFRGWRPTDNFFGQSLARGRDGAMMSLFRRQPNLYWAHPYSVILSGIPKSVTKAEVAKGVADCLVAFRTESTKVVDATIVELSNPNGADFWKASVAFDSKDQYAFFLKMARRAEGIGVQCNNSPQWIQDSIEEAKSKLEECVAVNRVHPSSLTMNDLAKAQKEYKFAKRGLCIFTEETFCVGHIVCMKMMGPLRNAAPFTAKLLFAKAASEIKEATALLNEYRPLMLQKQKTKDQLRKKIKSGVTEGVCQLTTVEALRALREGKADQIVCPICYDSLGHGNNLVALTRCGHMCCKECMLDWMQEKEQRGQAPSCIECRKTVRRDQLVTVDPKKKDDQERFERRRDQAKSLVQQAAAMLDSNHGQLPPHLWEALYLSIDAPIGVSQADHNALTAIPPLVLAHIRNATSMPVHCTRQEPRHGREYALSSKIRALLSDLPRDEVSVVFASSKTSVIHILTILRKSGIGCRGLFAGQTEGESKMAVSDWHSEDEVLVLVVQAGVAACGLTLTKASKMFLMEPFLKHEEEKQAYARLHR